METLLEVLTQYAEENLVSRLLWENIPKTQSARFRANQITKALSALNPEAEEQIETLEMELNNIHAYREQALLLSGISIGLKLGRL